MPSETYTIQYLNGGVSYTSNKTTRLVKIPFQLKNSSSQLVTSQMTFTSLKGAYTQETINSTNIADNYPHTWENPNTSAPQTPSGNLWTDTYIEYDSSDSTYYMYVPFGGAQTTEPEHIIINFSSDDTYDGDYVLCSDILPQANPSKYTEVSGCKKYAVYETVENNGETTEVAKYYLAAINLFIRRELISTSQGKDEYDNIVQINNYGERIYTVAPTSGGSCTPYLSWAIIDTSGNIKRIATYGKLLGANLSVGDENPYASDGMRFSSFVNDPNAENMCEYLIYSGIGDSTSSTFDSNGSFSTASGQNKNFSATIYGATSNEVDSRNIYFQLSGSNFTTSPAVTAMSVYTNAPTALSLSITGSSGSNGYTGFYKKHGRFFPSKYVSVTFSAISDIGMTYEISGAGIASSVTGTLKSGIAYQHLLKLASPPNWLNGSDWPATIHLTVTTDAGTTSETESTIKVIPKLYRTTHLNLRDASTEYAHEVTHGVSDTVMVEKQIDELNFTRSWNEIWYPETHGSPLNADGTINATEAIRVAKISASSTNASDQSDLIKYDKLAFQSGSNNTQLAVDSDGRYVQNTELWSQTKKYPARVNSRLVDNKYEKYWIIDNTGSPDFQLEFELFDFSSSITKYPENLCSRYSGDSVSVFDASAPGCLYDNPVVDENGIAHWQLKDSTKLVHLFSLKGSCFHKDTNPFTLLDSEIGGSLSEGEGLGFTCPSISSCSRICIVPFTDYGDDDDSRGSGFKLKAGPKHSKEYYNYEYQNDTGEFWIHMAPASGGNGSWSSSSNIKIAYSYYESTADMDVERGTVTFTSRPLYPLLATFMNYLYLYKDTSLNGYPHMYFSMYNRDKVESPEDTTLSYNASRRNCIMSFVATQDDFVDYMNMSFYVSYSGSDPVKTQIYDANSANNDSSGRLTAYRIDGDTGILRCTSDTPPRGRLFADYYHHTFYRLTSDGYGDLYFYGSGILVPASSTDVYKDWTYVDLKIVNEGSNTLSGGLLTFLARGYVTKGTVVDTVIDQNRPWDIQEGTTAETVNRTGARMRTSYASLNIDGECVATRANAFGARSSQTCSLGDIAPKGVVYVRVFWCIAANAQGTAWIEVSRGRKTYSAEMSGKYFIFN